jgi:hypothetical protein
VEVSLYCQVQPFIFCRLPFCSFYTEVVFQTEPYCLQVSDLNLNTLVAENFPAPQKMKMSFVIYIHSQKTISNIRVYRINSIALLMEPTFCLASSLKTNQATLWTKCSHAVAAGLFCCDNTGQIKIQHLYLVYYF